MVPSGVVHFLYLKTVMVTLPVISMESRMLHTKTNRTPLKDHFYAVGAMKKGKSTNADYEDDLPLFLGVESISDVTFFSRLQIREAVFHSRAYKRISRRNNYAIAYQQGDSIYYGYIEAFFSVRSNPSVACGAVIAPMSISGRHVCKSHEVLGNLISHIVCLHEPNKNRFTVAPPKDIIDI
ncbi:uncharacterized protein LOC111345838 [Stylophora pistillata]|uniref:uncharacterized protein LOC111345838 n=1 Tax=Stylophora pistillata TaxID=50429 RepID=UPI000C056EFE|nr:uncharacterized protein LOC111345838 [Stylophora pistillata]